MRYIENLSESIRAIALRYIGYLSKVFRKIAKDLYKDYVLNRLLILRILLMIFCVLALLHAIRSNSGTSTIAWLTSSYGKEVLGAMKILLTPIVILFGAIWSYYLFVRGRKFSYRTDIRIDLWTTIVAEEAIYVIIRFTLENIGDIRIVPEKMTADVSFHDGQKFTHLETNPDLMTDYIEGFRRRGIEVFSLEPQTALKTDWLLRLPGRTKTKGLPLLYVEVSISDILYNKWLEKRIVEFDRTAKGER